MCPFDDVCKNKEACAFSGNSFIDQVAVETAGVERVSSGMTYVKNRLHNSSGDELLSNCLVTYIENDVLLQVSNDDIIDCFRKMKVQHTQW